MGKHARSYLIATERIDAYESAISWVIFAKYRSAARYPLVERRYAISTFVFIPGAPRILTMASSQRLPVVCELHYFVKYSLFIESLF